MSELAERVSSRLRNSQTLRLVTVGILVLLLQIPVAMIGGQVSERAERGMEAVAEVSSKWGDRQVLAGPMLVVPFTHNWTEVSRDGQSVERTGFRYASFLPEELNVAATANSEVRKRGIFEVPVYTLDLEVHGSVCAPGCVQTVIGSGRDELGQGVRRDRCFGYPRDPAGDQPGSGMAGPSLSGPGPEASRS